MYVGVHPTNEHTMLKLTLSAPIASYGVGPRVQHRMTEDRPTRSAILGMLRCALGVPRFQPCPDLDALTITIGEAHHTDTLRDFHTLRNAVDYNGAPGRDIITTRHYLTESASTVTIDGTPETLERITEALRRPRWQLYLGRRSCVPDKPILAS